MTRRNRIDSDALASNYCFVCRKKFETGQHVFHNAERQAAHRECWKCSVCSELIARNAQYLYRDNADGTQTLYCGSMCLSRAQKRAAAAATPPPPKAQA